MSEASRVDDGTALPTPGAEALKQAVRAQRDAALVFFARLAQGSQGHPGITRDTYGAGENFGHAVFADTAAAAGLELQRDAAANTYATWAGSDPSLPRILMGSHLDSVPHGGNFDGAAGVLAGLVVIESLRQLGLRPRRNVTVMGVRAEESVWFQVSYIGSRSALASLPPGALDSPRIDTGRPLASHIAECGGDPEALVRGERFLDPAAIRAFLEVHIEQAPSLVEAGYPLAICTGIPGNFRFPDVTVTGRHDHVGTPRRFRRDAAMAATAFAAALDAIWAEYEEAGTPVAMTFGRFHTDTAMHGMTTVPGAFHFSLDVRGYDVGVIAAIEARIPEIVARIEAERSVSFDFGARASAAVGLVDQVIFGELTEAAARLDIPAMPLGSPASHDAAAFAAAGVPTAMLFVRNENGSHNPLEQMDIDDFLDACTVLADWVARNAG
ncbi:Zn-dependent hydrolase [Bosea sp. Root381]|uniref:hydantoinase/carbamoylase family amidase n=1 Tax=Bosea sp. Root381 TaxID=1736524 RepID=UPI0006F56B95|nr:hydantoinase/carbamoylase family amidase [Bosea sp. Root381]KRE06709.1 Zn-dependent hydrolase [Bosea sp. Root381]